MDYSYTESCSHKLCLFHVHILHSFAFSEHNIYSLFSKKTRNKSFTQKHLRLRGENLRTFNLSTLDIETPPLARRKPLCTAVRVQGRRNTSACAEKTYAIHRRRTQEEKHLRLRGENNRLVTPQWHVRETPSLARRKLMLFVRLRTDPGNTSACAEKTYLRRLVKTLHWKHLRLRGENHCPNIYKYTLMETPPLARRKRPCPGL